MTDHLLFQLYGSLSAWGEPAVGEVRHTGLIPGRSAITGLLAAALGIRRQQEEQLNALQAHYYIAVRQLTTSSWLRDFHTIQMPKENSKLRYNTRRDEILLAPDELQTMLSTRDYLCDAYYLIAIEATDHAPYQLETLRQALSAPVFPLYLGRKSCPPGLPLAPRCVQGELAQVLADETALYLPLQQHQANQTSKKKKCWGRQCFWEGAARRKGLQLQQTVNRMDQPVSRRRWQFTARLQHEGWLTGDDDVSVQN